MCSIDVQTCRPARSGMGPLLARPDQSGLDTSQSIPRAGRASTTCRLLSPGPTRSMPDRAVSWREPSGLGWAGPPNSPKQIRFAIYIPESRFICKSQTHNSGHHTTTSPNSPYIIQIHIQYKSPYNYKSTSQLQVYIPKHNINTSAK